MKVRVVILNAKLLHAFPSIDPVLNIKVSVYLTIESQELLFVVKLGLFGQPELLVGL